MNRAAVVAATAVAVAFTVLHPLAGTAGLLLAGAVWVSLGPRLAVLLLIAASCAGVAGLRVDAAPSHRPGIERER